MKTTISSLIVLLFFTGCNHHDVELENKDIIGRWELIAVLADPGDGSGVFMSVVSDKSIEIFEDGTVHSNGILCDMSTTIDQESHGFFNETDNTIESEPCLTDGFKIHVENTESILILSYQCIEACQHKYVKSEI